MSKSTIRNFILSTLCLLCAIGGFSFMVWEVGDKEQVLQVQLQTLNEEIARQNSFYKLQKLAEESSSDRDHLATYFLKEESDSIDVLNWIEGMAPQAHVNLQTKNLQKITDKDAKTDWIEVSFSFSGEQENVERFVAVLERLPYLSYVTSLSMSAQSSDNWEALVTLRVYIFNHDK